MYAMMYSKPLCLFDSREPLDQLKFISLNVFSYVYLRQYMF